MQAQKKLLFVLAVLLLVNGASGVTIQSQDFQVDLTGAQPKITQQYEIRFESTSDREAFNLTQGANTLESWRAYNPQISPQFGSLRKVFGATFSFDSARNILEMRYDLDESLSQKIQEDPRTEIWVVNTALFSSFQNVSTIQIPANTQIEIILPYNAEVIPVQNPKVTINRNVVQIAPLSTSNLEIQFKIPKPISPTFNTEFFQNLLRQPFWQAVVGAGIVLLALGYWQRKRILERAESYLIEHSEFSSGNEDDR